MKNIIIYPRVSIQSDSVNSSIKSILRAFSPQSQTQLLQQAGYRLWQMIQSSFGGSGQFRGNNWQRLSDQYSKRIGSSTPTLVRSGRLKSSIKFVINGTNARIQVLDVPYASDHLFGVKSGKKIIPQRSFIPLDMQSTSLVRLTLVADTEINKTIQNKLRQLSGGQLPSTSFMRSTYEYGNPFSSAASVVK
jgi:phage gpG-like protein